MPILPGSSRSNSTRGVTVGFIAQGRIAVGVIAMGGVAIGVIALGGVAIGAVALGGVSLGALAIGAIALGYKTIGAITFGALASGAAAKALVPFFKAPLERAAPSIPPAMGESSGGADAGRLAVASTEQDAAGNERDAATPGSEERGALLRENAKLDTQVPAVCGRSDSGVPRDAGTRPAGDPVATRAGQLDLPSSNVIVLK